MHQPLLSICIPTFNRAHLLNDLLKALENELASLTICQQTEIVVLSNASTDDTSTIVRSYDKLPVRFFENSYNIGAHANVLKVTSHARGKYAWIIGDDDLPVKNGIENILSCINDNQGARCIMINFVYEKSINRQRLLFENKLKLNSSHEPVIQSDSTKSDIWDDMFQCIKRPQGYLTSITSHVFLLSVWNKHCHALLHHCLNHEPFTSLTTTFPHSMIWIDSFAGNKVILLGRPVLYFMIGDQEWLDEWKNLYHTLVPKLYLHMSGKVSSESINHLINNHFIQGKPSFLDLLNNLELQNFQDLIGGLTTSFSESNSLWSMLAIGAKSKNSKIFFRCVFQAGNTNFRFYLIFLPRFIINSFS